MREIELKVPDFGETEKIELISWFIKEGDSFIEGDELCELVTDKAAFSIEAPSAGKLSKIIIKSNAIVKIGELVALLEEA